MSYISDGEATLKRMLMFHCLLFFNFPEGECSGSWQLVLVVVFEEIEEKSEISKDQPTDHAGGSYSQTQKTHPRQLQRGANASSIALVAQAFIEEDIGRSAMIRG